jgi:serine/threonine protein kinase
MPDNETQPDTAGRRPAPIGDPTISVTGRLEPVDGYPIDPTGQTVTATADLSALADKTGAPTQAHPPSDLTSAMLVSDSGTSPDAAATRFQETPIALVRRPGWPAIPGYEILDEIGRGGMGVVYKARQLDLNRLVAIKMILGEGYERPEQLIRFKLEAEVMARVRHTNVVQVHDSGTCNGRPYLVLEWVDGGTLSAYVKEKPQPQRVAARTVELLARAIHATHCAGIVHRDLKPGNVLVVRAGAAASTLATGTMPSARSFSAVRSLSPGRRPDALSVSLTVDGQAVGLIPKISDFGLAKEIGTDTHRTRAGAVLGTPEYMAPEQAQGRLDEIGPGTDIFALGAILYQMLTGRTPFHAESVTEVMRRVVYEQPVSPRVHHPKLARDLETICLKCLEKAPARRYATADDLADDLDAFLDGRPIAARPTGKLERVWKWAARRPAVAALSAAVVLAFVLGFAGVTWQWRKTLAAERQVRAEKAVTDAVNHFVLDDLLATATPEKQLGRMITVDEVLQNASARIEGRFADQPEVASAVRLVLGNSYRKLGQLGQADRHLTAAIDLRREHFGDTHRDTLAAVSDRGLLLADRHSWDKAIPLLQRTADDARATLGPADPLTIETEERLALVLQQRGDTVKAEELFIDALATAQKALGRTDPLTLTVLNDYGIVLQGRNKLPEAEAAFREAAEQRARVLAPAHPATLESLHNLAVVLDAEGKWADAKKIYQQVLADKRRVLGEQHKDTLSAMNNLAELLTQHGEPDTALPLLEDAYEGFRKTLGPENPETLQTQNNLGHLAFVVGSKEKNRRDLLDRAENVCRAVLAIRRRTLPPDHPDLLQSINNLVTVLVFRGELEEAEPLAAGALTGLRNKKGPGDPDTLAAATNYAQLLNRRNRTAEAVKVCQTALADAEKAGMTEHPTAVKLLLVQANLASMGSPEEALVPAEKAVALARKVFGESDDQALRARFRLGQVLMKLKRLEDAQPHLRAAYDAYRAVNATDTRTFEAGDKLVACLYGLKRYADAETVLLANYELLQNAKGDTSAYIRGVVGQLVTVYEKWGKPEKAAEWREKLK